ACPCMPASCWKKAPDDSRALSALPRECPLPLPGLKLPPPLLPLPPPRPATREFEPRPGDRMRRGPEIQQPIAFGRAKRQRPRIELGSPFGTSLSVLLNLHEKDRFGQS